jgi:iron-sulfur cluster repair protein YtfE (RIC family)
MNATHHEIRQIHTDLHQQLVVLHRAFCERQRSTPEIVDELVRLRDHLEHHFTEEEQGGFFADLVQRAPHHAQQVECLRKEHVARLEELEEMTQYALNRTVSPAWWEGLERRFNEFSRLLMGHEVKENSLLQEIYGLDLGDYD